MTKRVLLIGLFTTGIVVSLGFRLLLLFNRRFSRDEYEHLHYGWMVMRGYSPYQDFFQNDTPGFWYILAPLAWLFDERPAYLFSARVVMLLLTLAICYMVFRLSSFGRRGLAPLCTLFLLSIDLRFVSKTLEVRPDHFIILGWLFGLWFLLRSPDPIPRRDYDASGVSVGLGLLFSPKALFAIASLGTALLVLRATRRGRGPTLTEIGRFGLMSVAPLACLLLVGWFRDARWPILLVQDAFFFNFFYPARFAGFYTLPNPVLLAFAAPGLLLMIQKVQRGAGDRERRRVVVLAVSAAGAALAFYVFIPAPFPQSLLPCITFLAIIGGECADWIDDGLTHPRVGGTQRTLAICSAAALTVGSIYALNTIVARERPLANTNQEYLAWLTGVMTATPRSAPILDGTARYIFRPQASHYGHLGDGVLKAIASGKIAYDIPERCISVHGCPVIVLDKYVVLAAPWLPDFVRVNYAPCRIPDVYFRKDPKSDTVSVERLSSRG